ncbi:MAG: hypothetical protein NTY90_05380 [Candidatus Micrarchaeota archaeon]|nr:hypothetical protein [Candidatus Micrarchaeota archaeon]
MLGLETFAFQFLLPFLGLWEDFQLVMLVAIFIMLYWLVIDNTQNPILALIVVTIIFFVIAIPYEWVRVLLFLSLVFYQVFQKEAIKPWEW